jgi:hypothetical protein
VSPRAKGKVQLECDPKYLIERRVEACPRPIRLGDSSRKHPTESGRGRLAILHSGSLIQRAGVILQLPLRMQFSAARYSLRSGRSWSTARLAPVATRSRGFPDRANNCTLAQCKTSHRHRLQLRRQICWWWVICYRYLHGVPMALVPLIIRWGANASSDMPRRPGRCQECGWKGATLQHPSWGGRETEWVAFPMEQVRTQSNSPQLCSSHLDFWTTQNCARFFPALVLHVAMARCSAVAWSGAIDQPAPGVPALGSRATA